MPIFARLACGSSGVERHSLLGNPGSQSDRTCGQATPPDLIQGLNKEGEGEDPTVATTGEQAGNGWTFVRRHRSVIVAFTIAAIVIFAWAVWVLLWFVGLAQSSNLVPPRIGFWTMANLLNFFLNGIFWGLILVGIPLAACGVGGWMWWRRLPYDERRGFRFGKRGRSAGGGGGIGLLFFIAFLIKVYLDGNWDVAIGTYTVDYVVGSFVLILEWFAVIFGIPAAIALVWWVRREARRAPAPTTA